MTDKKVSDKTALKMPEAVATPQHPVMAVMAGFVLAIVMLTCGVCGVGAWWFRPQISEDKEFADRVAHEIVSIDIPTSFKAQGAIHWNVLFTMRVRGAYYELYTGDGVLTILEIQSRFRAEEDVRQHIHRTLLEKGGGGTELVIDDSLTTQREFMVRGQPVPFLFQIGEDRTRRDHRYHLIEGAFEGAHGETLISLRIDDDSWSEAEVEKMLMSLSAPPAPASEPAPLATPATDPTATGPTVNDPLPTNAAP